METLTLLEKENEILCDEEKETKDRIKPVFDSSYFGDFSVIVLLVKNDIFRNEIKPYEMNICGKKMCDWVLASLAGYNAYCLPFEKDADVLSAIKPHLKPTKFTAVFYSDTPLLSRAVIEEIFMYARSRDVNVLGLRRGYVFNTEYIKNAPSIAFTNTHDFGDKDFFVASNYDAISKITKVLKDRILAFHIGRGVQLLDERTTNIDCDVEIEPGAKIEGNVEIKGQSVIGKNAFIGSFSYVCDSLICENACVKASFVDKSKVGKGMTVGPFANLFKRCVE